MKLTNVTMTKERRKNITTALTLNLPLPFEDGLVEDTKDVENGERLPVDKATVVVLAAMHLKRLMSSVQEKIAQDITSSDKSLSESATRAMSELTDFSADFDKLIVEIKKDVEEGFAGADEVDKVLKIVGADDKKTLLN